MKKWIAVAAVAVVLAGVGMFTLTNASTDKPLTCHWGMPGC